MRLIDLKPLNYNLTVTKICCALIVTRLSNQGFYDVLNIVDTRIEPVCCPSIQPRFKPFYIKTCMDDLDINHLVFSRLARFSYEKFRGCECKDSDIGFIKAPEAICLSCGRLPRYYNQRNVRLETVFLSMMKLSKMRAKS